MKSPVSFLAIAFIAPHLFAAPQATIPRSASTTFRSEGSFVGGANIRADIKNLRVGEHNEGEYERWVIDFADPKTGAVGTRAPRFQIRYLPPDRFSAGEGKDIVSRPGKFQLLFQSIHKNHLKRENLKGLSRRSRYVAEIVEYPPIENGDLALELILRNDVYFDAHQPIERAGRLVLDLKHAEPEATALP